MIIIYEGPDGIGKNAFIEYEKALKENVVVFEYGKDFENTYSAWEEEITKWKELALKNITVLVSRSWLSENLYAPIFNRIPRMTIKQENDLTTRLLVLYTLYQIEVKLLILLPKDSLGTYTRLKQRGDDQRVIDNWFTIKDAYKSFAADKTGVIKLVYI